MSTPAAGTTGLPPLLLVMICVVIYYTNYEDVLPIAPVSLGLIEVPPKRLASDAAHGIQQYNRGEMVERLTLTPILCTVQCAYLPRYYNTNNCKL